MQDKAVFVPVTENIRWSISIKRFALFQSHLTSQEAEYEVIKEFALQ
jgi:2'-5' RNA ligase